MEPGTAVLITLEDMEFLAGLTGAVVESSRVRPGEKVGESGPNNTGGTLIRPGGRNCYPAFWIRDYAMSLASGFVTRPEQKHMLILTASRQAEADWTTPSKSLVPRGAIPDHIMFKDGLPIYFPGTYEYEAQGGQWGKLPALDNHFYFIHMAHYYVASTDDQAILTKDIAGTKLIDRLDLAFEAPPSRKDNYLVSVDETNRGVSFGFTDSIIMTGDLLFASVLKYRAARQLAELHRLLNSQDKAEPYDSIADSIRAILPETFADGRGFLRASTGKSCQPDVWGTAFAVYIGALETKPSRLACESLAEAYKAGTFAYKGNIRHVLTSDDYNENTAWDTTMNNCPKNVYQNGGYWGTPTGWVCYGIAEVDRALAQKLAKEYINDLRETDFRKGDLYGGPFEWIFPPNTKKNSAYMCTVTCPLAALRCLGCGK